MLFKTREVNIPYYGKRQRSEKTMRQFFKDYGELCKETGRFYKKHWKGVIVLNAVIIGAELAWFKHKSKEFDSFIENFDKEEEAQ